MQRWQNILYNIILSLNCLLLFLLFFETRLSVPSWLQVFGRMHPLVVHFPIVLVLLYLAFLFFIPANLRNENWYKTMTEILLVLSAVSAVSSALMGLLLSREAGYDADALASHKWMGAATSFGLFFLYLVRAYMEKIPALRYFFSFAIVAIVVLTGHLGGNITHGENYVLAPVTPVTKKMRAPFEDAFVYADLVQPILESKCMACHNSRKAKGELIMETKELLLKGGEEGKLWDTTKADLGLMMQRIHLPEDEKKHMPPAGKPQLTSQELQILYAWIKSGADFEKRVIELSPTDTLRIMAAKILKQSADEEYDFATADEKEIQKLSNDNRVITPLFINSPALTVNFFNRTSFKPEDLVALRPLNKQIVEMNLDNMPVKDDDLKVIAEFTNLRKLNLNSSAITGNSLTELKKLVNLKSLSLSGTTIKPGQLNVLISLPKLRTVYLWNTGINSTDIKKLEAQNNKVVFQTGFKGDTVVLKLTPPVLENEEQIITASMPVKIKHYIQGSVIRYTLDGTEPDSTKSPVYDGKLTLSNDAVLKAKAFKPGWIGSDMMVKHFFKSTFHPDSVALMTPADKKYPGNGGKILIDLEKGEPGNFGDGKWVGFRENPMEILLIFKKPEEIKKITISALKKIDSYIFPPQRIEVWGGMEEKNLKLLSKTIPIQPARQSIKEKGFVNTENLVVNCSFQPVSIRYIKLVVIPVPKLPAWHDGKGQKAWFFTDEIFVN